MSSNSSTMSAPTFWQSLHRPILGLAPMSAITDHPYRHIQKKYGAPALLYTEFTAVERIDFGDGDLLKDFLYDESQRPIIGQIYGHMPAHFRRMALLLCELGFDGIDINMGCPSKSIVHRGSGAGLIRTPQVALQILSETKAGVEDWRNGKRLRDDRQTPAHLVAEVEARQARLPAWARERRAIPVSLKTRIGYELPDVAAWVSTLLEGEPAAIALHGRTLRQGYGGLADWEAIARGAELARTAGVPVLGNGDVASWHDAMVKSAAYGLAGVLIGRASYGYPFVFRPPQQHAGDPQAQGRALLDIALEHAQLYEGSFGQRKRYYFLPMRKHLSWYVRGLPSASHLRRELVEVHSLAEATTILQHYMAHWRVLPLATGRLAAQRTLQHAPLPMLHTPKRP
jgi:nifR3 family TIM-barrel protein